MYFDFLFLQNPKTCVGSWLVKEKTKCPFPFFSHSTQSSEYTNENHYEKWKTLIAIRIQTMFQYLKKHL